MPLLTWAEFEYRLDVTKGQIDREEANLAPPEEFEAFVGRYTELSRTPWSGDRKRGFHGLR